VVVAGVSSVGVEDTTAAVTQWAISLASAPHGIGLSSVCGESRGPAIVGLLCTSDSPLFM
jgi:hypothetical protein